MSKRKGRARNASRAAPLTKAWTEDKMMSTGPFPGRSDDERARFAFTLLELRELKLNADDPIVQQLFRCWIDDLKEALKQLAPRVRARRPSTRREPPHLTLESELNAVMRKLDQVGPAGMARNSEVRAKYEPDIHARAGELYTRQRQLRERLTDLSTRASIHRAGSEGEWHYLDSRSAGDYRSQGYGADRYAEGSVQLSADVARAEGFVDGEDLVVLRDDSGTWLAAVRVEDEIDAEILRRMPGVPLREAVRLCWARGVNPRVFHPFLPHGFEERAGLDFFGRDLRASKAAGA